MEDDKNSSTIRFKPIFDGGSFKESLGRVEPKYGSMLVVVGIVFLVLSIIMILDIFDSIKVTLFAVFFAIGCLMMVFGFIIHTLYFTIERNQNDLTIRVGSSKTTVPLNKIKLIAFNYQFPERMMDNYRLVFYTRSTAVITYIIVIVDMEEKSIPIEKKIGYSFNRDNMDTLQIQVKNDIDRFLKVLGYSAK